MHKLMDNQYHLPQSYLAQLAFVDEIEGWRVIDRRIVGHLRWELVYEMIVQTPEGNYFRTRYYVGATEMQETFPYEVECDGQYPMIDDSYWVPADRVEPMQMVKTVYVDYVE